MRPGLIYSGEYSSARSRTKTNDGQYCQLQFEQAKLVSNLLFGTLTRCVCVELPGFPEQQYTA